MEWSGWAGVGLILGVIAFIVNEVHALIDPRREAPHSATQLSERLRFLAYMAEAGDQELDEQEFFALAPVLFQFFDAENWEVLIKAGVLHHLGQRASDFPWPYMSSTGTAGPRSCSAATGSERGCAESNYS